MSWFYKNGTLEGAISFMVGFGYCAMGARLTTAPVVVSKTAL